MIKEHSKMNRTTISSSICEARNGSSIGSRIVGLHNGGVRKYSFAHANRGFLIITFWLFALLLSEHASAEIGFTNGLMAYFPFNGNANDMTGRGHDGKVVGATLASDRFGAPSNCYTFHGSSYIVARSDGLPSRERTISLWFKPTQIIKKAPYPVLLGYGGSGCGNTYFEYIMNNSLGIKPHCQGFGSEAQFPNDAHTTDWHHLTVVTLNGEIRYFYDGLRIKSVSTQFPETSVIGRQLCLGVSVSPGGYGPYTDGNIDYFTGSLDDIRIYNRAMPDSEIHCLYLSESIATSAKSVIISKAIIQDTGVEFATIQLDASLEAPNNSISKVVFYEGNNILGEDTTSPYGIVWKSVKAGTYEIKAVVFNSCDQTTLVGTTQISVKPKQCLSICNGLVASWPWNSTQEEIIHGAIGTLSGEFEFTGGKVGAGIRFRKEDSFYKASINERLLLANNLTVEAWINPAAIKDGPWMPVICSTILSTDDLTCECLSGWSLFQWNDGAIGFGASSGVHKANPRSIKGPILPLNTFSHVAASIQDKGNFREMKLYLNGTLVAFDKTETVFVATPIGNNLFIGNQSGFSQMNPRHFSGVIDEVSVFNRALDPEEIEQIYLAGSSGKCAVSHVLILEQPAESRVNMGQEIELSVNALGEALRYQWMLNNNPLPNATNSVVTILSATKADQGDYHVQVSNCIDEVQSQKAHVTVNAAPLDLSLESQITVLEDSNVRLAFSVADNDNAPDQLTVKALSLRPIYISQSNLVVTGDGDSRILSFVPERDVNGEGAIGLTLMDPGGLSVNKRLTVNILPVNDLPTLDPIPNLETDGRELDHTVKLSGIGSGAPNEDQRLAVTASSDNNSLISGVRVDYSNRTSEGILRFSVVRGVSGRAMMTVTVKDDGGTMNGGKDTLSRLFLVTVASNNLPPVISHITRQEINEDQSGLVNFSIVDSDTASTDLTVEVIPANPVILPPSGLSLSGTGSNRTLEFSPAKNQFGVTPIKIIVRDSEGLISTNSFDLSVVPVNDPPTLDSIGDLTMIEDTSSHTIPLKGITTGATNEQQFLTITAVTDNPALVPNPVVSYSNPNANGTLTFRPLPKANGTATITVTIKDDGGKAGGGNDELIRKFRITVTPTLSKPPTVTLTTPYDGEVFRVDDAVSIVAEAIVLGGSISKVEFFRDATVSLGVVLIPPFSVSLTNLPEGIHDLQAVATDSHGVSAVSEVVQITVGQPCQAIGLNFQATWEPELPQTGVPLTLTITPGNNGECTAGGAVLQVKLDEGLEFLSATSPSPYPPPTNSNGVVTFPIEMLPNPRGQDLTLTVLPLIPGTMTNLIRMSANVVSTQEWEQQIMVTGEVIPMLSISKIAPGQILLHVRAKVGSSYTIERAYSESGVRDLHWLSMTNFVYRTGFTTTEQIETNHISTFYRIR